MNKKADELLESFKADIKSEHPHAFMPTVYWCPRCGVTERELHDAPRDSILWKECYWGVVGDSKKLN